MFNVGRLTRLSDTAWEDSSIVTAGQPTAGYIYHFDNARYQGKTTLLLQSSDRNGGGLEIDFDSMTIWWLQSGQPKQKLYQIIVTM